MDNQGQIAAVLHAQAGMLLFLGAAMLLAHHTSRRLKSNDGAIWFAAGALLGSVGLLLQGSYGSAPPLLSVIVGNGLFLGEIILLTKAVAAITQQQCRLLLWLQGAASTVMLALLAYFTWWAPARTNRVLVAMLIVPMLLTKPILLLVRARDRVIRPATLTFAAMLGLLAAGMLYRAWTVTHGNRLLTGASWGGTVFIAGTAFCFFWIDMLRLSAQLESQAMTDPLTGMLNRRAIETFARRELARCQRQGSAIAALMIDIDDFKNVNDRHGHSVGDAALVNTAEAIRRSLRAVDLAARIGGDEFLILLPDASEVTVRTVTTRLRSAFEQIQVTIPGGLGESIAVHATIGQTRSTRGDATLQDLIENSDRHLYEQKSGRQMRKVELIPMELLYPSRHAATAHPTMPVS